MDFTAFRGLKQVEGINDNATISLAQLPANILDVFIPGYPVISKFVRDIFGFDMTIAVSVALMIFGLASATKFIWKHASVFFWKYFTSFIDIESDDEIFEYVMDWLAAQKISLDSRTLMVKTGRESAWDSLRVEVDIALDPNKLLNFSNWDAKVPPTFQPYYGNHRFFHHGRYFEFQRIQKEVMGSNWAGGSVFREDEHIRLTCLGRSTQPLKNLIKEARDHYLDKEKSCTIVRRPAPKEMRGRGRNVWNRVATRPSRPIDTVVLDHDQKNRLLTDINEYLHPSTPRWYANRGIPYRRGYLLHGPPGTGKSSLAWAIAGVFGLDIYCISLVEPTLTEEDLGIMFTSLPRRCVVLLEDIDSAGLVKRQEIEETNKPQAETEAARLGAEISKAIKASQEKGNKGKDMQGISLSGLLNAIDGVASHEGRVLLMTTNFPEKLDEALIRPGRIDMKIGFTKATREQMCELFTRMYSPDVETRQPTSVSAYPSSKKTASLESASPELRHRKRFLEPKTSSRDLTASIPTPPHTPVYSTEDPSSPEPTELHEIAAAFAKRLPEDTFTPAEIQGFLLTRKKEPMRALHEVEAWRDMLIQTKEQNNKPGSQK